MKVLKIPRKMSRREIHGDEFMIGYYDKMDQISPTQKIERLEMIEKLRINNLPNKERLGFWKSFLN
jgi:hypothetical protein